MRVVPVVCGPCGACVKQLVSNMGLLCQNGEIEQVVTKLLRTTKALLEALTHWSQLRATTADILDFRETLERQFHSVSQAFEDNGVPMK